MADGVDVGSAFVERLGRDGAAAAVAWMRSIREAIDAT
jgi:tryptophan synthase alpha subunit